MDPVDEKRVVDLAGIFRDGLGGGVGETVVRTHGELLENELGLERFGWDARRERRGRRWNGRWRRTRGLRAGPGPLLGWPRLSRERSGRGLENVLEHGGELLLHPQGVFFQDLPLGREALKDLHDLFPELRGQGVNIEGPIIILGKRHERPAAGSRKGPDEFFQFLFGAPDPRLIALGILFERGMRHLPFFYHGRASRGPVGRAPGKIIRRKGFPL